MAKAIIIYETRSGNTEMMAKAIEIGLKGKVGAAFGSYGWSGESIEILTETMKNLAGMNVIEPGLRINRRPTEKGLEECREFGKKIAERIK